MKGSLELRSPRQGCGFRSCTLCTPGGDYPNPIPVRSEPDGSDVPARLLYSKRYDAAECQARYAIGLRHMPPFCHAYVTVMTQPPAQTNAPAVPNPACAGKERRGEMG